MPMTVFPSEEEGKLSRQEIAERQLIRDGERRLAIPIEWLWLFLAEARGGAGDFGSRLATIKRLLDIIDGNDGLVRLTDGKTNEEPSWIVDSRGDFHRPKFLRWGLQPTLVVKDSEGQEFLDKARALIEKAGTRIGIGALRPRQAGRFGQFKIAEWIEIDEQGNPVPVEVKAGA